MPVAYVVSSGPSGSRRQRTIRLFGMSLKSRWPARHTGPSVKISPPAMRSMGASGATRSCRPGSRTSRGAISMPYTSLTFFSGRLRTGLPVAAKIALRTAGVTTQMVGSPTPPQKSLVGTITVSTFGISASRRIW